MPPTNSDYNKIAGQNTRRTEALADGVFSIAMTLLVLDLRVPIGEAIATENDLWMQLVSIGPKLLSYFLSFMTLGIFWTAHSMQYTYIARSDRHLNWLSIFYLMAVSVVPFTTAFLSEHIHFKLALGLYWLNILFLGLIIFFHWQYAYKNDFLAPEIQDKKTINSAICKRIVTAQLMYAAAALLCFINNYLSIGVTVAIQLNYAIAPNFKRNK